MNDLFKYSKYRDFLRNCFPSVGDKRGQRKKLSQFLDCQTSLISLVLTDRSHLSEDMAFKTAQFLQLTPQETEFFLLSYHFERAGSPALRTYYQSKMQEILDRRSQIKERITTSVKIPLEVQAQYYSNWIYAAIHTVILNPAIRETSKIAKKLNLSENIVREALSFMEHWGFVARVDNLFEPGMNRIHLSAESPFITQHHRNWHIEAMRALDEKKPNDLNYSGALSMSKTDAEKIRENLLGMIEAIEKQIAPSKDEEMVGITLSFFRY